MSLALPAPVVVSPKALVHPKQTKLLGARCEGVGVITAVAVELPDCFCLITDEAGFEHHAFVSDLLKAKTTFPADFQPYRTVKRRVGYGLWNEMHELESVHHSDLTHVDDLEAAIRLPLFVSAAKRESKSLRGSATPASCLGSRPSRMRKTPTLTVTGN